MSEQQGGGGQDDAFAALFAAAESAVDRIRDERKAGDDEPVGAASDIPQQRPKTEPRPVATPSSTPKTESDRSASAAVTASLIKARNELGEILAQEKAAHNQLQEEHKRLQARLARSREQRETMQAKAERQSAEKLERERDRLIKQILPVLDNLERAMNFSGLDEMKATHPPVGAFTDGVEHVVTLFRETLKKLGVVGFSALGQPFDPAIHEAIRRVSDSSVAPNTVVEEYHRGFLVDGRLLRPALVVVAMA